MIVCLQCRPTAPNNGKCIKNVKIWAGAISVTYALLQLLGTRPLYLNGLRLIQLDAICNKLIMQYYSIITLIHFQNVIYCPLQGSTTSNNVSEFYV